MEAYIYMCDLGDVGDAVDTEGVEHVESFLVDLDVVGVYGRDIGAKSDAQAHPRCSTSCYVREQ